MDTNKTPHASWTSQQALILMAICLMTGITGGWIIRGARPVNARPANAVTVASIPATSPSSAPQPPGAAQLKTMADNQAAPLILKLKSDSKNPELLASIGNTYYDAQQYPIAVDYYGRALETNPSDAAVRTDMATAYWYIGNADAAITEFNKALTYSPNNPNTLFNLGLVEWQGKHNSAGAIADWKKLLATNPNYEARDKVEQMLSNVEKQAAAKPGATG